MTSDKRKKVIQRQLYRRMDRKAISLHDVFVFAGDREPTPDEKKIYSELKQKRGQRLFSDLLFCLTQQYFSDDTAQPLWKKLIKHKKSLSNALKRNVGISVAAIDYLTNFYSYDNEPNDHILIPETKLKAIAEIAIKDGLTGLYDAATFYSKLEIEIQRFKRYDSPVTILMIDIDDFKRLNDTFGHQTGDDALARISKIIMQKSRDLDICCRYGGEEFSVIMPHTRMSHSLKIAERIRKQVKKSFKQDLNVTISIGVATCPKDAKSIHALVNKADKALYRSKADGKNRVTHFP